MIQISDGFANQIIMDRESKTINGLEFVGNGYGKEDSIDKGLPTWNEKNIKNFLYLFSLIAQKINISDIVDNLTSTDTNKPLSAKQGKSLNDLISSLYTKAQIDSLLIQKLNISDIVDNLTSTDTNKPLSAKQGKALNDLISSLYTKAQIDSLLIQKINISDIVDNLTSTDTNKPLSAKQGKSLNDLISSLYTKAQIDSLLIQKLNISDIVDNLTSTDTNKPLSAKQGKALNDLISSLYTKAQIDSLLIQKINISDIVDNLTSTDTNKPLSAKQGKILNDLISSLYTKSQIDSLLSASGVSPSYPCSVFSTENMNFTAGSSSFKVVSENALSWVVQLTLDVEFSSVSDYSSGIVFSYDSSLLPDSAYSECLRTDSLACVLGGNISMSCYCYPMSSYGSGKFEVVFGVNPNLDYHICGDVTILVFK